MYRLIALDIDGTLLTSDHRVLPSTRQAIAWAREQGVRVVLSTGRSAKEAAFLNREADCDRLAVCLGGSAIADLSTLTHLRQWTIPAPQVAEILPFLAEKNIATLAFAGTRLCILPADDAAYLARFPDDCCHRFKELLPDFRQVMEREPVCKLLTIGAQDSLDQLVAFLRPMADVRTTNSGKGNVEIMPRQADKGTALALLCKEWGIAMEEVIAVGDSDNDKEMLAAAGVAVAMGNAPQAVKQRADYVTASNDEGGIAQAVYHLLGR